MSSNYYSTEFLPEIPYDYGMTVKEGIKEKLYIPQVEYWNKRLRSLSERNCAAYAREDPDLNLDDHTFVGIFFDGMSYNLIPLDEDDDPVSPYCLELASDTELQEEMSTVSQEIQKLKEERYVVERFLSGFMLFDPPPAILQEVFGDALGRACLAILKSAGWAHEEMQWDVADSAAMQTFLAEQTDIVEAMQQRMLLNMITL